MKLSIFDWLVKVFVLGRQHGVGKITRVEWSLEDEESDIES